MTVKAEVVELAKAAHRKGWEAGRDAGTQTRKSDAKTK